MRCVDLSIQSFLSSESGKTSQLTTITKVLEPLALTYTRHHTLFFPRVIGGRTLPCLLTVALPSALILIILRQLPCFWGVAPNGSSAACMMTAMLEVRVGQICAWPDSFRWVDGAVLRSSAEEEGPGRGGRVKWCDPPRCCWLPSKYCGFLPVWTSFDACLYMAKAVFLSVAWSPFSTGDLTRLVILSSSCREMSDCVLCLCGRWKNPRSNASFTCVQYISACLWNPSLACRELSEPVNWHPVKHK